MKIVSFVCEKGGVGKTMLADELYYHFERTGVRASLYSLDGQYVARSKKADAPEVTILDTAGHIDDKLEDIVRKSDVVVVPVRPSLNDIEPFTRTMDLIDSVADCMVFIVVNAATPFTMTKSFMEWLYVKDFGCGVFKVPQSEYLAQSIGSGHSVVGNDKYGRASTSIIRVCNAISDELGFYGEHADDDDVD